MLRANALALLAGLIVLAAPPPAAAQAQTATTPAPGRTAKAIPASEPVGHATTVSRGAAKVVIDMSDGSQRTISLSGGYVYVDGERAAIYQPGGPFERAWRAVVSKGGDLSTPELVFALRNLPAGELGPAAREAMAAVTKALPNVSRTALPRPLDVSALVRGPEVNLDSINQAARETAGNVVAAREIARQVTGRGRGDVPESSFSVMRLATDVAGLFGTLVALASLGFGALFFVPQRLEVVADTVRRSPIRAFFAGLFAQPLLLPALVTLIIGLVLTIVGALVVPFAIIAFVLAVAAAAVGGYLAVARVVGEIYVRRRGQEGTYTSGWSTYRYLVYGVIGLLLIWAPAVLLRWIPVAGTILTITALVFTWAMVTTGFGAAILSRAGAGSWSVGPKTVPQLSIEQMWTSPAAVTGRPTEARPGGP